MNRRTCLLLWSFSIGLLAGTVEASTVVRRSTAGLVTESDRIVTGRCRETESAWMDGTLVTLAYFDVQETLKGKSAAPVVLVIPGGIDFLHQPPLQLVYPGAPQITAGEEALLFLEILDDTSGTAVLVGFSQGLYRLPAGGQRAERDLSQLTLLEPGGRVSQGQAEEAKAAALLAEVRALVAEEVRP